MSSAMRPWSSRDLGNGIRICRYGAPFDEDALSIWWRPGQTSAPLLSATEELTIESERIRLGHPGWGHEIQYGRLALEMGLYSAIASQKGCYPGQEVIERIWSLGAPPHQLVQITWDAPATGKIELPERLPVPVFNLAQPPQEVGELTSGAHQDGLAIVKKIAAHVGTRIQLAEGFQGVIRAVPPFRYKEVDAT